MAFLDELSGSLIGGFTDSLLGGPETDEERRRRLEKERLALEEERLARAEANPVKQTIEINPATGEKMVSISGREQDLTAANPFTPTVIPAGQPTPPAVPPMALEPAPTLMPTAPARPPAQLSPEHQAMINQVMPPAGAAMPVAPPQATPAMAPAPQPQPGVTFSDIPGQEVGTGYPSMPALQAQGQPPVAPPMPQPAPVAAPVQPPVVQAAPPAAAPVNPMPEATAPIANAPVTPVSPTAVTAPAGSSEAMKPAEEVIQEQVTPPASNFDAINKKDISEQDLGKIAYSTTATPVERAAAKERIIDNERIQVNTDQANQTIQKALTGDPKAARQVQREMAMETNEGSWIKAILMSSLGLEAAATAEFAKLGIGSTVQEVTGPNGEQGFVTVNSKGTPIKGYYVDESGKKQPMDAETLGAVSMGTNKTLRTQANQAARVVMDRMQKENDAQAERNRIYGLNDPLPHTPESIAAAGDAAFQRTMGVGRGGSYGGGMMQTSTTGGTTTGGGARTTTTTGGGTTDRIFNREGGFVLNDAGKGPTMYGVNSESHPEVAEKIRNKTLTPEEAKRILDSDISRVKGINTLNGAAYELVADAAINQGVGYANKLVERFGNDAEAIAAQRKADYAALIESNPDKYKKYEASWNQRVEDSLNVSAAGEPARAKSIAEKIANYEMKPPVSRSKDYAGLMREVARINPDYDETKYATIAEARKKFTTGKQGDTVRSMNVAIDHLDTLDEAGRALKNGDLPLFNKIKNDYYKNTGDERLTDFNGIKSIVGSEVAKAVAGGQMALADRDEIRKELEAANSPKQLEGVIRRFQQLLAGQLKGLRTQYEEAGLKDFDKKLNPRTKKVLEGGHSNETKTSRSNW